MIRVLLLTKLNLLEAIRRQVHLITLFVGVGLLMLPPYINTLAMGLNAFERVSKDFGLTVVAYFGIAMALYMGSTGVPNDMERKTLHPLLARPLSRWQYLLAKYLAVVILLGISMMVLTSCLALSISSLSKEYDVRLYQAALGYWMESSLLCAVAMLFSIFASPALAGVAGVFVYLTGGLSNVFVETILMEDRQSTSAAWVANACKAIFPHFELFRIKDAVVHNLHVPPGYMLAAAGYALAWILLCLVLADIAFRRKEL